MSSSSDKPAKEEKIVPYKDSIFEGMVFPGRGVHGRPRKGEYLNFIGPRIPLSIYCQMLGFFNWCQKKLDSEGFLLLMLRKGKWSLGCPRQEVSGGSVDAHPEDSPEEFHGSVGDAHSHPGMGAFHSHIDDHDELNHKHGIYMVVSSDRDTGFSIFTSNVNVRGYAKGSAFDIDPLTVFELKGSVKNVEFPEEWKSRVKKEVYKAKRYKTSSDPLPAFIPSSSGTEASIGDFAGVGPEAVEKIAKSEELFSEGEGGTLHV